MKIKSIILTSTLVFGLTLGFTQLLNKKGAEPIEMVNKVGEYKAKSREKVKPYRYDGSKINHFNYTPYEQKKTVEVLMFNGIDYKFCFNTDGVPKSIDLQIFDKDEIKTMDANGKEIPRILLFEANGVMGKDITVTSDEMLKNLQAKKAVTNLKKVFIEYHIPIGDKVAEAPAAPAGKKDKNAPVVDPTERGVVVVSYGYKSI